MAATESGAALAELLRGIAAHPGRAPASSSALSVRPAARCWFDQVMVPSQVEVAATPQSRRRAACIAAAVRQLQEDGDGGTKAMDTGVEPGASVVPVAADDMGSPRWHRDDQPRGGGEWVLPPQALNKRDAGDDRILFLHGGSYEWFSPSDGYRTLTTKLAVRTGLPVFALDYRLTPEHPWPAAVFDALQSQHWIWQNGPSGPSPARRVFVCGDSAGGGLALSAFAAAVLGLPIDDANSTNPYPPPPPPTAIATWSAYSDLSISFESYSSRVWQTGLGGPSESWVGDPVFSTGDGAKDIAEARDSVRRYAGDHPLDDPRISPVYSPPEVLKQLPPTLMVVGDAELMLSDTTEYAARALESGAVDVQVKIYRDMWHVFPMYTELLDPISAARDGFDEVVRFIASH